jgi:hypothetical protein
MALALPAPSPEERTVQARDGHSIPGGDRLASTGPRPVGRGDEGTASVVARVAPTRTAGARARLDPARERPRRNSSPSPERPATPGEEPERSPSPEPEDPEPSSGEPSAESGDDLEQPRDPTGGEPVEHPEPEAEDAAEQEGPDEPDPPGDSAALTSDD